MAVVNTVETRDAALAVAKKSFWIGLKEQARGQWWEWVNGEQNTYDGWAKGQPNPWAGETRAVMVLPNAGDGLPGWHDWGPTNRIWDGRWVNVPAKFAFVCQERPGEFDFVDY